METLVAAETRWIDLTLIDLPAHARTHDPAAVEALAEDIKINGQLQEVVVTPNADRFDIVAGVGRTLAARKLGWEKLRCLVRPELSEFDRLHITFSENEEREDASPLYQSGLLKRMKGDLSQGELAAKIGKSRDFVNKYLMISSLEEGCSDFGNRFPKLGVAHLLQICRLKTPKEQVQLAEQASKGEWSVKHLKGEVDKRLAKAAGKKPPSSQPPAGLKKDPFANRWPDLKTDFGMESAGAWDVAFKKGKWNFIVDSAGVGTPEALTAWFRQMGEALGKAAPATPDVADSTDLPETTHETAGVQAMQKRAHLPKTAEEEAELYALASQSKGPGPIYAKLYGPLNPLTRMGENMTWAQFQITDPKEALRQLLDAIRKAKEGKT